MAFTVIYDFVLLKSTIEKTTTQLTTVLEGEQVPSKMLQNITRFKPAQSEILFMCFAQKPPVISEVKHSHLNIQFNQKNTVTFQSSVSSQMKTVFTTEHCSTICVRG